MGDNEASLPPSMPMYFTANAETILLFKFWETNTPLGLLLSCLIVLIFVVLYEVLFKLFLPPPPARHHVETQRTNYQLLDGATSSGSSKGYGAVEDDNEQEKELSKWGVLRLSLRDGGFHGLRQTFHYVIMLIVMTYNVWVGLAVVMGSAIGQTTVTFVTSYRRRRRRTDATDGEP